MLNENVVIVSFCYVPVLRCGLNQEFSDFLLDLFDFFFDNGYFTNPFITKGRTGRITKD